ncbi:BAG family molecular chaperone regulator 4 isoform X1 [Pygocentrus nattereri]|uniref:BAG domain-containing protein n=1 Tax=Pygocentrus nattereri TaxID=42514 RepID=A0AAR2KLK8_PYGNA|nr:BAG family molecular chaperone regulator 4 isoform X1 [Pygocentrus nattereri]
MAYDSAGADRSGEAAWLLQQQRHMQQPKAGWSPGYNPESSWSGAMDSNPYCGYPPNYWYPHSHTAGPYGNAYPSGAEVNGQAPYNPQAMSGYPNGVYNPGQYSANMMHPSNPFYCSEQIPPRQPPQYHNQPCPDRTTGNSSQPPYPVPHCQGGPGYPPSSYPHYGDGCPPNAAYTAQRPQPEAWPHSGGYGPTPPQQQWPSGTQPAHGPYANHANHVRPPHPPPWQGPAPPPYEHKQEPPYPGPPHLHPRNQPAGLKPRPNTPNPGQNKPAEFSAPPQIYSRAKGGAEPKPAPNDLPSAGPAPATPIDNPSLARVQQVLARVQLLQEDVDEFVGKKTDKSYRYLEELLTKELLELDSVETNGQDSVRHARKEAVQKIQAILDRLEKKAF